MNVLYSMNLYDNNHQACTTINKWCPELAEHLVHIESGSGINTILVFSIPKKLYDRLEAEGKLR